MTRDLILGTAGHIDHGKTTLVKALTGIDCDRLPEEKARGITIDIGFAILDLPGFRLGIVDVPGHERFVKNMLAGATGIDLAVLVVSAKESVKPQTREHLEILRLLGLRHGVIALTMCDLVDQDTREVVELEVRDLVQGTFLAGAPVIATAAPKGEGIEELKAAIAECCQKVEGRAGKDWFRLPIDRSFIVQGHGTVVTGSVISGSLKVGDEVEWLPSGQKVRVRSLQNHDHLVEEVHRGQRAAINLAGVHHEDVLRGQELATPGYLLPSKVVTVRLHCIAEMKRSLKHRMPVRFHVGTSEVMATLSLLDCDQIEPGKWGLAQLFLEEPATTAWGQPFVLRESSATETLGGGQVLQPAGHKLRRRHLEVLERVERLWTGDARERAITVAWFGGYGGFTVADLVRGTGLAPDEANELAAKLKAEGQLREVAISTAKKLLLHKEMIDDLEGKVLAILDRLHEQFPLMSTHDRQKVQSQLDYVGDDTLVQAVVEGLMTRKILLGDLRRVGRADFKPKLSANLRKLKDKLIAAYQAAGFQPPEPGSFANQAGGNAANLRDLFDVCVAEGHLAKITDEIYLHADADADMRRRVVERLRQGSGLTVAEIRDLLGTTRKYAVPLCEYLDRVGVTRRENDLRFLAEPAAAPAAGLRPAAMADNPYRKLPAVNAVLQTDELQRLLAEYAHDQLVAAVRGELDALRQKVQGGEPPDGEASADAVARRAVERLVRSLQPKLVPVINATGIVLHTNLGRAPIAREAAEAARHAAGGYLNLELDLASGKRSSRQDAIREWVCRLTGAESATAVNNNAAATVIVLRAIAQGKEVIVSRGQLIEIGGSFRIPEIMAVSGAILREVGTTNITRLSDYERAIGPNTGAILQVHPSNYRVSGFTESASLTDLVTLGRKHNLPVLDDIGSGALVDFARFGFRGEPFARHSVEAGADLVLFSGDKLLGGPQAGIIAGKSEWVRKIEKDPLMRAFRLDKMTLAALEATLRLYLNEEKALREIPVLRLLGAPLEELKRRAESLAERLARVAEAAAREDVAYVGGGSLPDQAMKTWVVELCAGVGEEQLAARLRGGRPAVMARVRDGKLVLDVRTVFPEQEDDLVGAVTQALQE